MFKLFFKNDLVRTGSGLLIFEFAAMVEDSGQNLGFVMKSKLSLHTGEDDTRISFGGIFGGINFCG